MALKFRAHVRPKPVGGPDGLSGKPKVGLLLGSCPCILQTLSKLLYLFGERFEQVILGQIIIGKRIAFSQIPHPLCGSRDRSLKAPANYEESDKRYEENLQKQSLQGLAPEHGSLLIDDGCILKERECSHNRVLTV